MKCKACDYGCNFEVLSKNGKNIAVRAKSPSEGRPLCLKGRLTTELLYLDQPETPYKKVNGEFHESTWKEALELEGVFEKVLMDEKKHGRS